LHTHNRFLSGDKSLHRTRALDKRVVYLGKNVTEVDDPNRRKIFLRIVYKNKPIISI
jgi:hypothetical protein